MGSSGNPWEGDGAAAAEQPPVTGSSNPKLSKKMSEKFERTKEVASTGFEKTKVVTAAGFEKTKVAAKKVKDGASVGVNWIKLKYNKSKLFQKK
ncbi:hypothetical protein MIMGU_mgv1a017102mg [Erythranthe guttata]|uniref:Uncharacterized protein n=1 Tax=Erythranthe guttata TaxID=4155 RepID=A0A022Q4B6_ERYGU|nr:hypothetical protein MIMGU_mgv1a017102mg [Erythranthe guttata]